MFINQINAFLPQYQNIVREDFLMMLRGMHQDDFFELKFEKDFLLTLILIRF
jgi:hypothetical protein